MMSSRLRNILLAGIVSASTLISGIGHSDEIVKDLPLIPARPKYFLAKMGIKKFYAVGDIYEIAELAEASGAEIIIGHSKGYKLSKRLNIPLVRVGFPIHDRIGGQRILHIGYRGAQQLFDLICNTLIGHKQDSSSIGYSYM